MITLRLTSPGDDDLVLRTTDGEKLTPDVRTVCKHFQLTRASIEVIVAAQNKVLAVRDDHFIVPPCVRQLTCAHNMMCHVSGKDSTEHYESDPDPAPQSRIKFADQKVSIEDFADRCLGEAYMYLKSQVRPARFEDPEAWKNFRQRVKRTFELDSDGKLWYRSVRTKDGDYCRQFAAEVMDKRQVILSRDEMRRIILQQHQYKHDRFNRVENTLNKIYKYVGLRKLVHEVVSECVCCHEMKRTLPKMVKAIITSRPYQIVMWDLF